MLTANESRERPFGMINKRKLFSLPWKAVVAICGIQRPLPNASAADIGPQKANSQPICKPNLSAGSTIEV